MMDEFDIDGIRLDAADVLDFDFMKGLRRVANEVKPEFWLMGEVIHGDYSRWANPEMLHSVTNYELHKGLWSGHNDHNYFEIAHTMRRLQGLCHDTRLYNFSDNHDAPAWPVRYRRRWACPKTGPRWTSTRPVPVFSMAWPWRGEC